MACAPLTADRQALAERHIPLAYKLARPYRRKRRRDDDELVSAVLFALVGCAGRYDPGTGVPFPAYLRERVRGAILDHIAASRNVPAGYRGDPDAPGLLSFEPGAEGWTRVLTAEPDEPTGASLDAIEAVEQWLRRLPARHAEVCRWIYLHGKPCAEVSRLVGCSYSRVTSIHREALAMLRGTWTGPQSYRPRRDDAA